ncbi:hypothetical protein VPH35_102627 [Triticum aestivum]
MSNPGGGATATAAAQNQRALLQKADADVGSLVANLSALIVHSADSLLKLVSELKRTAIFSGLASLSENVDIGGLRCSISRQRGTDRILQRIGQEAATAVKELEAHYYSSVV